MDALDNRQINLPPVSPVKMIYTGLGGAERISPTSSGFVVSHLSAQQITSTSKFLYRNFLLLKHDVVQLMFSIFLGLFFQNNHFKDYITVFTKNKINLPICHFSISIELCTLFKHFSQWDLDLLPRCCEWLLRLWGCMRASGITPGEASCDARSDHPALLRPRPAITAATSVPSREGAPQYLNRAFSAPRICTVEAGYLARLVRLPA